MGNLTTGAMAAQLPRTVLNEKKKEKPRVPDDPQSVVAKTRARKLAATEAATRRGRASTILSDTVG